jgi:GH15 family glucan-1,4-alpha-glucosidase
MATVNRDGLVALARRSVEIILANQAPSGAYPASPTFPVYRYCWLRDGAFIADAMSRAGEVASAEAFFGWCAKVLTSRRAQVESLLARRHAGQAIPAAEFLHTRYTLDGAEADTEWWNFQLDGYGAWLWALDAHARRHGRSIEPFVDGAKLSAAYIAAFWDLPSYDWWEEHADHRHSSTLAAIYAGLRATERWPGVSPAGRNAAAEAASAIESAVRSDASRLGHLTKWIGGTAVDASLVAVSTPFELLTPGDPLMRATVERIEAGLVDEGGVHRYASDTYYGGGEWLLLSALLGWHLLRSGDESGALRQLGWVAAQATPAGELPEQVDTHLLAPEAEQAWLDRWGPIATPLLWSHAMYLTLALETGIFVPAAAARRS